MDLWIEVAFPKRITVRENEAPKIIKENIKNSDIYISNYKFSKIIEKEGFVKVNYLSAIVNNMFFDIDGENFYENTMKFHKWLEKKKILHRINLSGNGFHVIVFIKQLEGFNKKIILYNAMRYLDEKLNINAEKKTFGDIARIRRLENTFNFKAKRFCIPLDDEIINLPWQDLIKLAEKPRDNIFFFGSKLLDIENIGSKHIEWNNGFVDYFQNNSENIKIEDIKIPTLIQRILNKKDGVNYRDRFLILTFFRNLGISKKDVIMFLSKTLTTVRMHHNKLLESDFQHMMREKQVDYIYTRMDVFPSYETLKREGYCFGKSEYDEITKVLE